MPVDAKTQGLGLVPVRVSRRRVLQHDLDMYAAISGNFPTIIPVQATAAPTVITPAGRKRKPWSISTLARYLGSLPVPLAAMRVVRPETVDWVRRLSSNALGRLQEAQDRLNAFRSGSRQSQPRRRAG